MWIQSMLCNWIYIAIHNFFHVYHTQVEDIEEKVRRIFQRKFDRTTIIKHNQRNFTDSDMVL